MSPTSFAFEVIPLSPIAYPPAHLDAALCADNPTSPFRTLMRGNTFIGVARTILQASLRRAGEDAHRTGGLQPDVPLRCSDIIIPRESPVMQGIAINLHRQRNSLSTLAEPAPHSFVGMDLVPKLFPRLTVRMTVDPKRTLMAAFAAACNQFYRPQWEAQCELLERYARSAGQRYLFDAWLQSSRRRWTEYEIARRTHIGDGFLMRIGHWAGCEARTHNNNRNPRHVRSRRSTTGRYTARHTPKTWWVVAANESDTLQNAAPLKCAPIGWIFLRLVSASVVREPRAAVNGRATAARLAQQWSVFPVPSERAASRGDTPDTTRESLQLRR